MAGYEFRFVELAPVRGPNFVADEARFEVTRDGELVASLAPQKRRYLASGSGDDRGRDRRRSVPGSVCGDG